MDDRRTRLFIETVMIHNKNFPNREFYPFNLKVFQNTDRLDFNHQIIFFVGENGTGKSTLLESLARSYGLTVWGGEKVHITHRNPYETKFHRFISVKSRKQKGFIEKGFLFRSENFFNYACYVDDLAMYDPDILKYYGGK